MYKNSSVDIKEPLAKIGNKKKSSIKKKVEIESKNKPIYNRKIDIVNQYKGQEVGIMKK